MVWACVAKRRQWLVKKCMQYEVEGSQEVDHRGLGERLCKKTVEHVNRTGRVLWIVVDTALLLLLLLLQLFYGPWTLSGTTWVSRYQMGKTIWIYWRKRLWVAVASAGPYANLHQITRQITMEEADKRWLIIRIGVSGWMFLLVPPG